MSASVIRNPILPGFNPDPSIVRVGEDYYIATSTFEWYPGVQIHHSKDLKHWRLAVRPLDRVAQLDMRGNPDSCGVWAPCLSYDQKRFWLVYTNARRYDGNFKDTPNYLVTAPEITGPWSDPVYLNASGFDPSLFHDDDGRKWIVNMIWDHRATPSYFGGIALQEYDPAGQRLIGSPLKIFSGTQLGCTEGPHLYKRNGWYYLLTAEGGTGYDHAVTLTRSRRIEGPYEVHPGNPLLTAKGLPDAPLQRCGHGDIVDTSDGRSYLVHLCSRPLSGTLRSVLGRETAIQEVVWHEDGWLRLANGESRPQMEVCATDGQDHPFAAQPERHDFNDPDLPLCFQWLRTPHFQRLFSLRHRPGYLRLFGRESIGSWFEQSLVARRQTDFAFVATTAVEFAPDNFQQMAGLVCYYNRHQFHWLAVTHDEVKGRVLVVVSCPGDYPESHLDFNKIDPIGLSASGRIHLRAHVEHTELKFSWSMEGHSWFEIPVILDMGLLSDEGGRGEHACFTGAFVGMVCQDVSGGGRHADFDHFSYSPIVDGASIVPLKHKTPYGG